MNLAPALTFISGAVAMLVAAAILIPIQNLAFRSGPLPRLASALALLVPFLAALLLATRAGDAGDTGAVNLPQTIVGTGAGAESDWSDVAHAFAMPAGGAPHSGAAVEQQAEASISQLEAATRNAPGNPAHWLALARTERLARDYSAAIKA